MDIKKRRFILLGLFVAWGVLSPLLALLAPGTSTLSLQESKILIPLYPLFWLALLSCKLAHDSEKIVGFIPSSNFEAYAYFFTSQFIICAVIGIIVTFIVYPPWIKKKSPKTD